MSQPSTDLLTLDRVTRRFKSPGDGEDAVVLQDVSLVVQPGERMAIVGPSGSGKSTLMNIIGALDRPTGGRVVFDGRDLDQLDDKALAAWRNRSVGFIFQMHHLLGQLTLRENVLVPTIPAKTTRAALQRADQLLQRVGLADHAEHRPGQLSGGQCQRAAVVRALINQPRLLLADEPTGSLDHANAQALMDLLLAMNEEQSVALIVVTHDMEMARRVGRVHQLRDGRLSAAESAS
jgi:ABC-type lipoprotein export system ATPase subunit